MNKNSKKIYAVIPDWPEYKINRNGKIRKNDGVVPYGRGSVIDDLDEAWVILSNKNKKQTFKIRQLINQAFPEEMDKNNG